MRNCTLTFPHVNIVLDNLRQILTLATTFPFDILQLFYTLKLLITNYFLSSQVLHPFDETSY